LSLLLPDFLGEANLRKTQYRIVALTRPYANFYPIIFSALFLALFWLSPVWHDRRHFFWRARVQFFFFSPFGGFLHCRGTPLVGFVFLPPPPPPRVLIFLHPFSFLFGGFLPVSPVGVARASHAEDRLTLGGTRKPAHCRQTVVPSSLLSLCVLLFLAIPLSCSCIPSPLAFREFARFLFIWSRLPYVFHFLLKRVFLSGRFANGMRDSVLLFFFPSGTVVTEPWPAPDKPARCYDLLPFPHAFFATLLRAFFRLRVRREALLDPPSQDFPPLCPFNVALFVHEGGY